MKAIPPVRIGGIVYLMRWLILLRALCLMLVIVMAAPLFGGQVMAFEQVEDEKFNLYFGDLHTHTGYSDAYDYDSTPWTAFAAAIDAGADFMATTDHIQIWNAYDHWVMTEEQFQDSLDAAAYYTSENFVAMAGYEAWMLASCGEVNVYNVDSLPPTYKLGYRNDRLPEFYDWLASQPGAIGQFNHPLYVSNDFRDYDFLNDVRDSAMTIIEAYNAEDYGPSYIKALDAGWHLMPSANSDTHYSDWIAEHEMRTVLLANALTPEDLYDAMRNSRGYGTLDKNLQIYYTLNDAIMGSDLGDPDVSSYVASIHIEDPDGDGDEITKVEIVTDGGVVLETFEMSKTLVDIEYEFESEDASYFFVRVSTASPLNGDEAGVTAWTAPVWTGR